MWCMSVPPATGSGISQPGLCAQSEVAALVFHSRPHSTVGIPYVLHVAAKRTQGLLGVVRPIDKRGDLAFVTGPAYL